jgi:glucans biosynthesis protein C
MTNNTFQNRLVFLDNLRYLIVLLVVVLHVSVGYSNGVPWWYVVDFEQSWFFDFLNFVLDSFIMPVLFFIAGYFALSSLRQKTMRAFIATKLKRLGIPFILCVFFLVPIMPYFYHYTRATTPLSFEAFWLGFVKSIGDFQITIAEPSNLTNDVNLMNEFGHHHLWFISLLLFFCIGFALLYQLKAQFSATTPDKQNTSMQSIWVVLLTVGLFISLSVIAVNYFISAFAWANFYHVLVFQPVRLPLYLGLFGLGIYAYSKNWLTQHALPGSLVMWFMACMILLLILLGVIFKIFDIISDDLTNPIPFWLIATHSVIRTFLVLAWLVFLISLTHRYWNRPSKLDQSLAANSYYIYLIHLPIVVILQFVFLEVDISIFIKFSVIVFLSILLSYGISHFLMSIQKFSVIP